MAYAICKTLSLPYNYKFNKGPTMLQFSLHSSGDQEDQEEPDQKW